jgi:predicted DNA-binding transcriptional regulator AlpA
MATTQETKTNERFLRKRQLADRYQTCTRTIDRWTADGRLPKPVHIGTVPMWALDEIEAFEREAMKVR